MTIVAGFDVHRAQITFDALNQETGEVKRKPCPDDRAATTLTPTSTVSHRRLR